MSQTVFPFLTQGYTLVWTVQEDRAGLHLLWSHLWALGLWHQGLQAKRWLISHWIQWQIWNLTFPCHAFRGKPYLPFFPIWKKGKGRAMVSSFCLLAEAMWPGLGFRNQPLQKARVPRPLVGQLRPGSAISSGLCPKPQPHHQPSPGNSYPVCLLPWSANRFGKG